MKCVKPVYYWALYALLLLAVVACAGFIMRLMPLASVPGVNYEYLLHAHSHLAFLGWVYNALFAGLVWAFVPREEQLISKYNTLFWITQVITACMFIAFLTDGYQTPAIIALAGHTIVSYLFTLYFLNDSKKTATGLPGLLVKAALFCLFLSSLGPFAIPVIKNISMNPDHFKMAINFYLHFQYNGWFVFGVLAILVMQLPDDVRSNMLLKRGSALLLIGVIPTYFLSVQMVGLPGWMRMAAGLAGAVQLAGAILTGVNFYQTRSRCNSIFKHGLYPWALFGFAVFAVKSLFLMMSVSPEIYNMVFHSRNVMIAYLHWHFLGFITLMLFVAFGVNHWLPARNNVFRIGLALFLSGFLLQEIYLFAQAALAWFDVTILSLHLEILLLAALLLLAGTVLLMSSGMKQFQTAEESGG